MRSIVCGLLDTDSSGNTQNITRWEIASRAKLTMCHFHHSQEKRIKKEKKKRSKTLFCIEDFRRTKEPNPWILFDLFYCNSFYRFSWVDSACAFVSLNKSHILVNEQSSPSIFWIFKGISRSLVYQIHKAKSYDSGAFFAFKCGKWDSQVYSPHSADWNKSFEIFFLFRLQYHFMHVMSIGLALFWFSFSIQLYVFISNPTDN